MSGLGRAGELCAPDLDCFEAVGYCDGTAGCYTAGDEGAKGCGHVGFLYATKIERRELTEIPGKARVEWYR